MHASRFAAELKAAVKQIQEKGVETIRCENLIAYLDTMQDATGPELTEADFERYKADLQRWVNASNYHHQYDLEMFKSVIAAGQGAIKSAFLLNGGASVALLAFIAHLAENDPGKVGAFDHCLLWFAFGALAIAVTSGFTYLSQWFFADGRKWAQKTGFVFNVACILLGLTSYGFFVTGMLVTYDSFAGYG